MDKYNNECKSFFATMSQTSNKKLLRFPFNDNLLTISVLLSSFIAYTRRVDLCRTYKHKNKLVQIYKHTNRSIYIETNKLR